MLLRNGDKKDSKQEQFFNNSHSIMYPNNHISNTAPLFVKTQCPISNALQEQNVRLSKDFSGSHNPIDMMPINTHLLLSSNQDTNTNYIPSIPPQIQSQTYFNPNSDSNISYGIPPLCYQQYQQITSSASYLNQGIQIQQNIVSTTTMISPSQSQYINIPQIIHSTPVQIQGANVFNNILPVNSVPNVYDPQFLRSQSHNGIRSSLLQSENTSINPLNHSFKNLSTDDNTGAHLHNSLNNSCHFPINTIPNKSQPRSNINLNCPPPTNINYSSISLPQSNLNLESSLKTDPLSKSKPYTSTTSVPLQSRTNQISNSSSLALRSSHLPPPVLSFDKNNLTPSRRMINVIEERVLIPSTGITNPVPNIMHITKKTNCNPNIMRCTLNTIPMTEDLLNKTRLPLAILLHPFRDLPSLQVIRSKKIIRCRTLSCRAYINPFVSFTDQKRWKCNMCLRMNELSEDSVYNSATGEYLDTLKRFELRLPTVEYIAPKEYSLKNTQVPVYLFLVDVSKNATTGLYPNTMGKILNTIEQLLDRIPGYQHARFAIIGYDSYIHFYTINDRVFQEIVMSDISSPIEIPVTSGIVVDMNIYHDTIQELLSSLMENIDDYPRQYQQQSAPSCLGSALLVAKELLSNCGGRITIFNASCPNIGEGILVSRDESKSTNILPLSPDKEFYKTLSLEFAQAQIGVDLFQLGSLPCDLASLSIITRYCSGSIFYFPSLSYNLTTNELPTPEMTEIALNETQRLVTDLHRYLTRKIGFEGVLRIRFSSGFNILSSHGNFFARASDLYSMANVNPDSGIAIRLGIEDNFIDANTVFIQAALLYTSSVGERRIRVHTLCLPVSIQIEDLFRMADHQAIAALLAKTVSDRLQISGNVIEAREALINAVVDPSVAFGKFCLSTSQRLTSLPFPYHLRMLPLYVWGILQSQCLRVVKNKIDLSVSILDSWRNKPLSYLIIDIYPNLYNLIGIIDLNNRQREMFQSLEVEGCRGQGGCDVEDNVNSPCSSDESEEDSSWDSDAGSNISCYNSQSVQSTAIESTINTASAKSILASDGEDNEEFWYPEQLHLTMQSLTRCGVYLLDTVDGLILVLGADTPRTFLKLIFGVDNLSAIGNCLSDLPDLNNPCSAHLRVFVRELQIERPLGTNLFIVNSDRSVLNRRFMGQLFEDDQLNASYHRFLQHAQKKVISNINN